MLQHTIGVLGSSKDTWEGIRGSRLFQQYPGGSSRPYDAPE